MMFDLLGFRWHEAKYNVLFGVVSVPGAGFPAHNAVRNMAQLTWLDDDELDTTIAEHNHDV